MQSENLRTAEQIMNKLLVGSILDAIRIRFDIGFTLLFDTINLSNFTGEIFLHLTTPWCIMDYHSSTILDKKDFVKKSTQMTPDEQIVQLHHLRNKAISGVKVEDNESDLSISFGSDTILLVSGNNPLYESWEFGTVDFSGDIDIKIVTAPGGNVTIWSPPSFDFE